MSHCDVNYCNFTGFVITHPLTTISFLHSLISLSFFPFSLYLILSSLSLPSLSLSFSHSVTSSKVIIVPLEYVLHRTMHTTTTITITSPPAAIPRVYSYPQIEYNIAVLSTKTDFCFTPYAVTSHTLYFSYNADLDSDPYAESLWYFNYFFYNKKMKRILFFSCQAHP